MRRRISLIWMAVSAACWFTGWLLRTPDSLSEFAFWLNLGGWLSFLLAVGLFSTPSTAGGNVAFGFVTIMVIGIAFKVLHFSGGNTMILSGLIGSLVTYGWMRRFKSNDANAP